MIKNVICKRCGYSWDTQSEKLRVNCPKCLTSVRLKYFEGGKDE